MDSPLTRSLEQFGPVSETESRVLSTMVLRTRQVAAGKDIVREGSRPLECCLILDGFACRYKLLSEGRRQIMSFHIPGDICDLQNFLLPVMDHSIAALTRCLVGMIPHQTIHMITETYPHLTRLLWHSTLLDAAVFREWLVGVGRRSALARVAHLFCEILLRLEAVGLAKVSGCELPLTQTDIGDALGLTNVHVSRVLQELRRQRLITSRQKALVVHDWEGLKRAAEFEPSYLHILGGAHQGADHGGQRLRDSGIRVES